MEITEQGVNVEIEANGIIGSIMLNSIDFSKAVSSIIYRHDAGKPPTLELSIGNIDELEIKSVVGSVLLKGGVAVPKRNTATLES